MNENAPAKKQNTPFDLSSLDTVAACDRGAEIELNHPVTREPVGVFFEIVGKDSNIFRNAARKVTNDRLRQIDNARRRGRDPDPQTEEDLEETNIEILAACIKSWRTRTAGDSSVPVVTLEGQQLPFTQANAKRVLKAFPFIYEQINTAIGELENFMPASSKD